MFRQVIVCAVTVVLAIAASDRPTMANQQGLVLAVVMSNDPGSNSIQVYDTSTHALHQTLSTQGKGGVSGNARGVRQRDGELVAVVNNGSNTVALFRRVGDDLAFAKLVTTTSAPVSVDFGNDHMYVAGATTVDSFPIHGRDVGTIDGTALLEIAGGGAPLNGSTAQVGVVSDSTLLVTLKTDPNPGTVDIVALQDGAIAATTPVAVPAPTGTLTPFGFSVYPDGTALITLAHSSEDGLFRDGSFVAVIGAGQVAPCWTTRTGKYVFTANTGSGTISRLVGTGSNIFIDSAVAASITTGGAPSDIDAEVGVLGVIDHSAGGSHLSLFHYDRFGELTANGNPISIGVAGANGVAVMPPAADGHR